MPPPRFDVCRRDWQRQWLAREHALAQHGSKLHKYPTLHALPRYPTPGIRVERDWLGREVKYISREEVARHNSATDVWIIVHDRVYDASSWVQHHPGGVDAIMNRAGGAQDASRDFDFHSPAARRQWRSLYVGELDVPRDLSSCAVM